MKNIILILLFILFYPTITFAEQKDIQHTFQYDFLWEIFLPGYNFYRKEEMGWGNVFSIIRIASLYSALYYHRRFVAYNSLYKAAQWADLYYGLGYSYADPVDGGYKNTRAILYRKR
ncbi:MAG: hypothetical protein KatS3mg129_2097 [Leptospiraceae bacterium]|nr:MAG: hypothetical protein KatS3mg129_2097 [Leptospiraceae bacterium]